jgi:hypothetical protein
MTEKLSKNQKNLERLAAINPIRTVCLSPSAPHDDLHSLVGSHLQKGFRD